MLTTITTTKRNRVAYAHTLLINTNRITDAFETGDYASGVVTITSYANLVSGADDVIQVAGVDFTAQAGAANLGEPTFQAATSNTATATSLAAQINGFDEAGALAVNRVTAVASGVYVTITADNYGTAANTYTLTYTDNDANVGATVSGATLLGGTASVTTMWYNERLGDRRDKSDEYKLSTTYPALKAAIDSSDIQNVRTELTTTEKDEDAFVKTLNVNLNDVIKVIYFDADESLVYLAQGAFKTAKYRVTHTRAQILALQNAVYKRGVAGTGVVATEYGDGDQHRTVLELSDVTITVTLADLAIGSLIYTLGEGYANPTHFILDLSISSDTNTDTPEMGIGHVLGAGAHATIGAAGATMESIYDGTATGAITPVGVAVALRAEVEADYYPDQGVAPYDGSAAGMPIYLNWADGWGAAGDVVINGTITLWHILRGDD